jgi:SAM-dependent methyltransferase
MIESSNNFQSQVNGQGMGWGKLAQSFHPVRHLVMQIELFGRNQLRRRGLDLYLNSPDRVVLEDRILLYLAASARISRVLFVGCDWYTKPYSKIFKRQEYWTIDPDRDRAKYGSPEHHIVDGLENLSNHRGANYFDLIVCNNVFGYGLDTIVMANQALDNCSSCLKESGILLIGWHHMAQLDVFVPSHYEAMEQFTPYVFPALSTTQFVTDTPSQHTFNFYTKRVRGTSKDLRASRSASAAMPQALASGTEMLQLTQK